MKIKFATFLIDISFDSDALHTYLTNRLTTYAGILSDIFSDIVRGGDKRKEHHSIEEFGKSNGRRSKSCPVDSAFNIFEGFGLKVRWFEG